MSDENSTPKPTPPKPQLGSSTVPPKAPNLNKPTAPKIGTGNTKPPVPPSSLKPATATSSPVKPSGTPTKSPATQTKFSVTKSPFKNSTKSKSQFKVTQSPFAAKTPTSQNTSTKSPYTTTNAETVVDMGNSKAQPRVAPPTPPSPSSFQEESKTPWLTIALSGVVAVGSIVLLALLFKEFNAYL